MKRLVIKVGSGVLTENNAIAKERMLNLVSLIAKLQERFEVILVSSGAVASGYTALKLDRKKHIGKKALASVGQPILMSGYKRKFEIFDITTSQILLTEEDFDSRKRTNIFREIINTLLSNKIVPLSMKTISQLPPNRSSATTTSFPPTSRTIRMQTSW